MDLSTCSDTQILEEQTLNKHHVATLNSKLKAACDRTSQLQTHLRDIQWSQSIKGVAHDVYSLVAHDLDKFQRTSNTLAELYMPTDVNIEVQVCISKNNGYEDFFVYHDCSISPTTLNLPVHFFTLIDVQMFQTTVQEIAATHPFFETKEHSPDTYCIQVPMTVKVIQWTPKGNISK